MTPRCFGGAWSSSTLHPISRTLLKILAHAVAIGGLYLAFSGALFLGLQVDVIYGAIALLAAIALIVLYVYFGFLRK